MIKPMLAQVYDSNKFTINLHSGVMVQPKLDGIRCIFTKMVLIQEQVINL